GRPRDLSRDRAAERRRRLDGSRAGPPGAATGVVEDRRDDRCRRGSRRREWAGPPRLPRDVAHRPPGRPGGVGGARDGLGRCSGRAHRRPRVRVGRRVARRRGDQRGRLGRRPRAPVGAALRGPARLAQPAARRVRGPGAPRRRRSGAHGPGWGVRLPPPDPVALGLAVGWAADRAFGDPRRGHPVAALGRWAGRVEARVHRESRTAGVVAVVAALAPALALGVGAGRLPGPAKGAATAVLTWAALGGTSLGREGTAVHDLLLAGDRAGARVQVRTLVGRVTDDLSGDE